LKQDSSPLGDREFFRLVSSEDLRAAGELAFSLIMDRPRSQYSPFTNSSILQDWVDKKSRELAKLTLVGGSDPDRAETMVREVLGMAFLESFLIAYILLSKINAAVAVGDSGAIEPEDLLKVELWERGLLPSKFYRFGAGKDPYLVKIKKNHAAVMTLSNRVKKMKATVGKPPTAKKGGDVRL